ncbi:hypothetical protein EJ04DRAFT_513017 [Polyplosphaeria fusca]|uniref:Uncharacterized protein n=1 Tax=Polyplosphaeria fusca TaxID=682080 RepID=A0A9P4V0M0_9PLEO|nr:hypothetical protein EJ04DRAFT_513017 [Polyplosphaeria fusca]
MERRRVFRGPWGRIKGDEGYVEIKGEFLRERGKWKLGEWNGSRSGWDGMMGWRLV